MERCRRGQVPGVVVLSATMTISGAFTYQGGLTLAALFAAALIGGVTLAGSSLPARCFSLGPIRYVGRISYGLYLWHWPIFVVLDGSRTGLDGPELFTFRLIATFAAAVASFHLIEMPIRRGALRRSREMRIEAGSSPLLCCWPPSCNRRSRQACRSSTGRPPYGSFPARFHGWPLGHPVHRFRRYSWAIPSRTC